MELQVAEYTAEYQPYFERFNKAWLEEHFSVEPLDKWVLEQPEEAILKDGGKIYFAVSGSEVIGTVALRFIEEGVFEMTKMAVDRAYRGGGAGKFLCQTAIQKARALGVERLILYSNRVLKNAIHIYHKAGFTEIPVSPGTYKRADIMMEIAFGDAAQQVDGTLVISEEEIQQFRAETRGTHEVIHFNNAGSSLPPDVVVDTVVQYIKEEALLGGYETEFKYQSELENTYALIARLINAGTDEIALVENASIAWGLAFNGIEFKMGDEVITSEMEYITNLIGLLNAQKLYGIDIKIIPNDAEGNFSLPALEEAISPKTKLIAVTHIASTAGGMIPIVEIGRIARKHGILYLVDACQSAGQIPIDVDEIGCDMLSVTGRKYLRAPRGTGFLYVRKTVQDNLKLLFLDGFSTESVSLHHFKLKGNARRFELYERNRALTLGLSKAVEYALNIGVDRIWQRVQQLASQLRGQLSALEGVSVHDFGGQTCGIVTFSVKGHDASSLKTKLAARQINVSVGLAKSTLIYMEKNKLESVVRASVHYYNTLDEITELCAALKAIIANG